MAPNRGLAIQIERIIKDLGYYLEVRTNVSIGGVAIKEELKALEDGVHVVVGIPGRLYDIIKRSHLDPKYIKILVLDEADEMLC